MCIRDSRWVAAYLGITAAGCAVVPLDTALHADQLTTLLKDSGTSAVFCDAKHSVAVREALAELNVDLVLMDPERIDVYKRQPCDERQDGQRRLHVERLHEQVSSRT